MGHFTMREALSLLCGIFTPVLSVSLPYGSLSPPRPPTVGVRGWYAPTLGIQINPLSHPADFYSVLCCVAVCLILKL